MSVSKVDISAGGELLEIAFGDGLAARYHAVWLRDNAPDPGTRDPANGQRLITIGDIPRGLKIGAAKPVPGGIEVTFAPEGLTVRELVAQGRFPHQSLLRQWTQADEDAVNGAMETAGITDFADRSVDTLSGGQRQRCWVAMVLAQETELILLDEPTTFLDLKVQVDLMNLLTGLAHERGRTLVIVLHELSLAAAYADHLVMMKDGQIVASGDPDDIFTTDRLKQVFDLDASVLRDPASGRLVCVPFTARRRVTEAAQ